MHINTDTLCLQPYEQDIAHQTGIMTSSLILPRPNNGRFRFVTTQELHPRRGRRVVFFSTYRKCCFVDEDGHVLAHTLSIVK